ncbi:hypothetical protein EV356DRAFT_558629 [Viridothelium virens]|uniref:EthD domain-containing protein n=1 Tax=Viridothelium virens TaxID=1048519 RepID=A0A6A6HCT2_VIRVR|nr:hypothetical protein EV356DRAFT_558629 [Viridothelium virens]
MVLEAGYPGSKGFRKVTKVTVLIKKKEGLSDEEFTTHYNNIHAQMAVPVLLRHDVITYSLTYHLQRDRTIMRDMLHGKAQLLPYDAICTFVFPDYRAFAKFMYDPESKAMNGDHENFMDASQMKMMVGDEYMVIDDGKRVEKD